MTGEATHTNSKYYVESCILGDFSTNRRVTNTKWMANDATDFWKLPWSVHSDFDDSSRWFIQRVDQLDTHMVFVSELETKTILYKVRDLLATCIWQWCGWTSKWQHEGGTHNVVYRQTTKCHRMQCLFSWHYRYWKDVLILACGIWNTVYKPSYSARSWLSQLLNLLVCMVRKVVLRSHPMKCQHTSRTPHTYCSGSNLVANVNSLQDFPQNKSRSL